MRILPLSSSIFSDLFLTFASRLLSAANHLQDLF